MLTLALLLHVVGFRGAICLNGNPTVTEEFRQREGVVAATVPAERYEPPLDTYFTRKERLTPSELMKYSRAESPRLSRFSARTAAGGFRWMSARNTCSSSIAPKAGLLWTIAETPGRSRLNPKFSERYER